MYIVGLTGGIASGKTAVSDHFATLGATVIDTDIISRKVVEPDTEGLSALIKEFGKSIISADGTLNRAALRQIIFSDNSKREALNRITHPLIEKESQRQIDNCQTDYCILVVPLLIETQMDRMVDRILVVDVPKGVQIQRLLARDSETIEQAEAIISSQIAREDRLKAADDILINDKDINKLKNQVECLHNSYIEMSKKKESLSV